jgi:hypothetical protein
MLQVYGHNPQHSCQRPPRKRTFRKLVRREYSHSPLSRLGAPHPPLTALRSSKPLIQPVALTVLVLLVCIISFRWLPLAARQELNLLNPS